MVRTWQAAFTNPFENKTQNTGYCGYTTSGCVGKLNAALPLTTYSIGETIPMVISVTHFNNVTNLTETVFAEFFPTVDSYSLLDIPDCTLRVRPGTEGGPRRVLNASDCIAWTHACTPTAAALVSVTQPNITLNIITQNGFLAMPIRQWSDGVNVVGFRSVVITLANGTRKGTRKGTLEGTRGVDEGRDAEGDEGRDAGGNEGGRG